MKICQWFILFFLFFSLSSPLYAQIPKSIVREYYHYVLSLNNAEAYTLISTDDRKIVSKEEFGRSPWPFLYQGTLNLYIDLFSIEILNEEIKDNRAYVKYKLIGPMKLYMQAWKELSKENREKIINGVEPEYISTVEFQKLLEKKILKLISSKNYVVDKQIRTVELYKEKQGWRLHLNFRSQKQLQETLKIISTVDRDLGYTEYGEINLEGYGFDERLRIYNKALAKYERSKDIIGALTFVSEEEIEGQQKLLDNIQIKIDKLTRKIRQESENH